MPLILSKQEEIVREVSKISNLSEYEAMELCATKAMQYMADKACEYLSTVDLSAYLDGDVVVYFKRSEFIDDFKQALEYDRQGNKKRCE